MHRSRDEKHRGRRARRWFSHLDSSIEFTSFDRMVGRSVTGGRERKVSVERRVVEHPAHPPVAVLLDLDANHRDVPPSIERRRHTDGLHEYRLPPPAASEGRGRVRESLDRNGRDEPSTPGISITMREPRGLMNSSNSVSSSIHMNCIRDGPHWTPTGSSRRVRTAGCVLRWSGSRR